MKTSPFSAWNSKKPIQLSNKNKIFLYIPVYFLTHIDFTQGIWIYDGGNGICFFRHLVWNFYIALGEGKKYKLC